MTTADIDRAVHDAVIHVGAYPSPLGYGLFPKSCTTSVNNVIARASPLKCYEPDAHGQTGFQTSMQTFDLVEVLSVAAHYTRKTSSIST